MVILTKHEKNVQKSYESSKFPREFGGARLLGSDHLITSAIQFGRVRANSCLKMVS